MRNLFITIAASIGAALVTLTTPASAGGITVTDIELPYNDTLTITSPISGQGYVGQQVLTTNLGTTIDAWCIDLYHDDYVGAGQNLQFGTSEVLVDGEGNDLSSMQVAQIAGLINYGDAILDTNPGGWSTQALSDFSASIQLAIWTDEYSDFTYTGSQTLTDLVSADMTAAAGHGGELTALISLSGGQGLVTADPALIPEPASLALLGGGALALGVLKRRRTPAAA